MKSSRWFPEQSKDFDSRVGAGDAYYLYRNKLGNIIDKIVAQPGNKEDLQFNLEQDLLNYLRSTGVKLVDMIAVSKVSLFTGAMSYQLIGKKEKYDDDKKSHLAELQHRASMYFFLEKMADKIDSESL